LPFDDHRNANAFPEFSLERAFVHLAFFDLAAWEFP